MRLLQRLRLTNFNPEEVDPMNPIDEPYHSPTTPSEVAAVVVPLRDRSEAARRLPPARCGCADPWTCRHSGWESVRPTPVRDLDILCRAAAMLIARTGFPGIYDREDVVALWDRNFPGDREIAAQIARLSGWTRRDSDGSEVAA